MSHARRSRVSFLLETVMFVRSPHTWWSILKSAVSGPSSSLFTIWVGGLVYESVDEVDLLLDHFDSKHSSKS